MLFSMVVKVNFEQFLSYVQIKFVYWPQNTLLEVYAWVHRSPHNVLQTTKNQMDWSRGYLLLCFFLSSLQNRDNHLQGLPSARVVLVIHIDHNLIRNSPSAQHFPLWICKFKAENAVCIDLANSKRKVLGEYNRWTGLLDWTTGLDYWTGLLDWTTGLDYWTGLLDCTAYEFD